MTREIALFSCDNVALGYTNFYLLFLLFRVIFPFAITFLKFCLLIDIFVFQHINFASNCFYGMNEILGFLFAFKALNKYKPLRKEHST